MRGGEDVLVSGTGGCDEGEAGFAFGILLALAECNPLLVAAGEGVPELQTHGGGCVRGVDVRFEDGNCVVVVASFGGSLEWN